MGAMDAIDWMDDMDNMQNSPACQPPDVHRPQRLWGPWRVVPKFLKDRGRAFQTPQPLHNG
jgi:hypothetical protein